MMSSNKVIVILGPTASGKSSWAVDLAIKRGGEIISADSRQIYKEMDIGTAKITPEEMKGIPHHLLDIVSVDQIYTAADFQKDSYAFIDDILSRKQIPFLAGGTGLYIESVIKGYDFGKAKPNDKLRSDLNNLATEELYTKLQTLNNEEAQIIGSKNRHRLIRALEIASANKQEKAQRSFKTPPYKFLQIGIKLEREMLHSRINQRVKQMSELGLENEVKQLANKYGWDSPAMSGLGYRQFKPYFNDETSLDKVYEQIKIDTRKYAKRQMTWFRRDRSIKWVEDYQDADQLVTEFLS